MTPKWNEFTAKSKLLALQGTNISHFGKFGKSSTQTCQTGGDMLVTSKVGSDWQWIHLGFSSILAEKCRELNVTPTPKRSLRLKSKVDALMLNIQQSESLFQQEYTWVGIPKRSFIYNLLFGSALKQKSHIYPLTHETPSLSPPWWEPSRCTNPTSVRVQIEFHKRPTWKCGFQVFEVKSYWEIQVQVKGSIHSNIGLYSDKCSYKQLQSSINSWNSISLQFLLEHRHHDSAIRLTSW